MGPFLMRLNSYMTNDDFSNYQDRSELDGPEPEFDENAHRWDKGGLATADNGIADRLLQNDKLYNTLKSDWQRSDFNLSRNILTTTGREDGKTS